MTEANEPAMPLQYNEEYGDFGKTILRVYEGLTKKEFIATMALQGLLSKYNLSTPEDQITIAKVAIELTDTFISELNK